MPVSSQFARLVACWVSALMPLLLASVSSAAVVRGKTDVVVCDNADRLSCEIKEMRLGKLRVKTDTMSTVHLKWERVTSITSAYTFLVELDSGQTFAGSLADSKEHRVLTIYTSRAPVYVSMDEVARLTPVGRTFVDRLDGYFDLGFNYSKSTGISQLHTSLGATYRVEKYLIDLSYDSSITTKSQEGDKRRFVLNGAYRRFYQDRYFSDYALGATRNDELGLQLRTYGTAGVGRYLVQESHQEFTALGGLSGNHEDAADDESTDNVEGLLSLDYAFYRFTEPEANIVTYLKWYPSLTEWGRQRIDYDVRLKYEIVSDFYWTLSFYYSYDSEPPSGAAAKDDYGVVNAFGYSW